MKRAKTKSSKTTKTFLVNLIVIFVPVYVSYFLWLKNL